jgi:hypothetical protein
MVAYYESGLAQTLLANLKVRVVNKQLGKLHRGHSSLCRVRNTVAHRERACCLTSPWLGSGLVVLANLRTAHCEVDDEILYMWIFVQAD